MAQEKANLTLLLLKLLDEKDRYGYEIIETLAQRSDDTFCLKAGTLYPLLHGMEKDGFVTAYTQQEKGRTRKYYHITEDGKQQLLQQTAHWNSYAKAVSKVLRGGVSCAGV